MQFSEKMSKPLEKTPFYCRPFCFLASVCLLAMFLFAVNILSFTVYSLLVLLYATFMLKRNRSFSPAENPLPYLTLAVILFAVGVTAFQKPHYTAAENVDGESTVVKAVIKETVYNEKFGSMYYAELKEIGEKKVKGYAYIEFSDEIAFVGYDTVLFEGTVKPVTESHSLGETLSNRSKRIIAEITADSYISVDNSAKKGAEYFIYSIREKTASLFDGLLSPRASGYIKALMIGDKNGISESFRNDVTQLGLSHVLAISGMHLSLFSGLIVFAADKLKTSRRLKSAVIIAFVLAYSGVAGFSPSVLRAGLMLCISLLAAFTGRRSDPLTALMASAVIICTADTGFICSCSFLLSFFATLGLVLCAAYVEKGSALLRNSRAGDLKEFFAIGRKAVNAVAVTVCASLFTVPVLSVYFSEFSFFAVFVNPVAVPLVFVSMVLGLLLLLFSGIPGVSYLLISATESVYAAFRNSAQWLSDTFQTTISLRYPTFVPCLILLGAILVYFWLAQIRNPVAVITGFLAVAIVFVSSVQIWKVFNKDEVSVQYIASKTSEIFVVYSQGKTLLIDIGNGSGSVPESGTETAGEDYYVTETDTVMLTHYHSSHIGTLKKISMSEQIKKLILPLPENDSECIVYENIAALGLGMEIQLYTRGDAVEFGNVNIQTTVTGAVERSAHPVIVLSICHNDRRITYLGSSVTESDIYTDAEKMISESGVIICGNHGPVNKESSAYFAVPENALIYASPYNNYDSSEFFPGKEISMPDEYEEGTVRKRFSLSVA